MLVLFIGDIIGKPGRRALQAILPTLRDDLHIDVVVANGENVAGGRGLTNRTAQELFDTGVDIISSGNHIWDQKEVMELLDSEEPITRPANYPPGSPGRGWLTHKGLTVLNLQGRTFMQAIDCPFRTADAALGAMNGRTPVLVDFHAEATSEKVAMGWYLDGRVAAVCGTHTHVPTADQRLLTKGTAFVSDAGMTGARDSVIGFEIASVHRLFLTQLPTRLPVEEATRDSADEQRADRDRRRRRGAHDRFSASTARRCSMPSKGDFHNHSTASDGRLTPTQLVDLAARNGVKVFALTDHDSTEGLAEARAAAAKYADFTLVPGVELSTDIEGDEVHVLGYLPEPEDAELQAALKRFRDGRFERGRLMVEKLTAMGKPISWERVKEIAGEASIGRPHVALAMVEAGYVRNTTEAFDLYIGRNGPAYVEREKMTPVEAVADAATLWGLAGAGPSHLRHRRWRLCCAT